MEEFEKPLSTFQKIGFAAIAGVCLNALLEKAEQKRKADALLKAFYDASRTYSYEHQTFKSQTETKK
jgi:hypothetical protein